MTADYQERETVDEILASWQLEITVPDDVRRRAAAELDRVGLGEQPDRGGRIAG